MISVQVSDRVADAAAGASVVAAATSWLAHANEVAQLIGTIVAIFSGVVALAYHLWRWRRESAK